MLALSLEQNCQMMWSKQVTQWRSHFFPCFLINTFSWSVDSSQIHFCPYVILSRLPQPAAREVGCFSSAARGTPSSLKKPTELLGPGDLPLLRSFSLQQFLLRFPRVGHSALPASLCDLSSPRMSCPEGHQPPSKASDSPCSGGGWNQFILCWSTTLLIRNKKQFN